MHIRDGDFRICGRWANNLGLWLTDQQLHTPSHPPRDRAFPLKLRAWPGQQCPPQQAHSEDAQERKWPAQARSSSKQV